MSDIFDQIPISKLRTPDIFDQIKIDKRIIKEISNNVKERLSKDLKVDIFDTIKIELPGLLKKYVQPEKKEIVVTNEIINAIRAEVMREFGNLPKPKPVEKVIERKVIEKQEIKIENPIDVESIKKEFDKKLGDAVKKAKKDSEDSYRVVIAPAQFPNLEQNVGKYLSVENSNDGLRTKWTDAQTLFDARYVNIDGDTMTGNLNAPSFTAIGTDGCSSVFKADGVTDEFTYANSIWTHTATGDNAEYVGIDFTISGGGHYSTWSVQPQQMSYQIYNPDTFLGEYIFATDITFFNFYKNAKFGDGIGTSFGTDADGSIYYDGTNLVVNPKAVGTGFLSILGDVQCSGATVTSLNLGSAQNINLSVNSWITSTVSSVTIFGGGTGDFTTIGNLTIESTGFDLFLKALNSYITIQTDNTTTGILKLDADSHLVNAVVGTDFDNYWTRTGTVLSSRTAADSLALTNDITVTGNGKLLTAQNAANTYSVRMRVQQISGNYNYPAIQSSLNLYIDCSNTTDTLGANYSGYFSTAGFGMNDAKSLILGAGGSTKANACVSRTSTTLIGVIGSGGYYAQHGELSVADVAYGTNYQAGRYWVICDGSDITYNFAHDLQTNPTLFIHSAAQSTTQWLSFTHDGTDGVINVGTGTVKILDNVTLSDVDIVLGTTTGTKIGTATSQKLGFYNATPVDQPATVADATDAASVILRCNDIIDRLQELGLIA